MKNLGARLSRNLAMGSQASDAQGAGINALSDFYGAWPYNTGISLSGLVGSFSDQDLQTLGGLYLSLGASQSQNALQSAAASWGMNTPGVSDLTGILIQAGAQSPGVLSAVAGTAASGFQSVGAAGGTLLSQVGSLEKSAVSGVTSLLSSPKTVILIAGVLVLGVTAVLYYPEIRAIFHKRRALHETA